MQEAFRFAELLAASDFVPREYRGKPGNVIVAIQMGAELGLSPMASLQGIAVVNGRPSVWGDVLLGLLLAHPSMVDLTETLVDGKTKAVCSMSRRVNGKIRTVVREFSVEAARRAKLWGKDGPWTAYPDRMLAMRARAWAARDLFADVLRGISVREEMQDVVDARNVSADAPSEARPAAAPAQPTPEGPRFTRNYHVVELRSLPMHLASAEQLTEYISYYESKLPEVQQPNHRVAIERTIAAAKTHLESRLEMEIQAAADAQTTEGTATTPAVDYDPETGEVASAGLPHDDFAARLQHEEFDSKLPSIDTGDTNDDWGLSDELPEDGSKESSK